MASPFLWLHAGKSGFAVLQWSFANYFLELEIKVGLGGESTTAGNVGYGIFSGF